MPFTVVYDASVLYPAPIRDLLMEISIEGLVFARWTDRIHDEWQRNLIAKRPELAEPLARTLELMQKALPDATVRNYEALIENLELPDANDRHVLAAAIKCGAQTIVTANLKDFPPEYLDLWDIEVQSPDIFLEHQLDLAGGVVINCAKRIRARLRNPPVSSPDYLETLAGAGAPITADKLREFETVI